MVKKTSGSKKPRSEKQIAATKKAQDARKAKLEAEKHAAERSAAVNQQIQDENIFNKKKIEVIDQQKIAQELTVLSALFNDATSSKENAKAGLTPQNNIVRVIDDPMFSTAPKFKGKLLFAAIGFAISIVVIIIPLLIQKALIDGREEDRIKTLKAQGEITHT